MKLTRIKSSFIVPMTLTVLTVHVLATELKTDVQKESYSLGASTGNYISNQLYGQLQLGAKTDIDLIVQGFEDALKQKLQMDEKDIIASLNKRAETLNAVQKDNIKKEQETNAKKEKEFLASNEKKDGVIVTKSGLQYKIIKDAKGEKPKPESIVIINYKASLSDGYVFDDTYERKTPAHLSMINVIDGLKEGLMLMSTGSKYTFYIPSKLAYGSVQMRDVPPNSTLVFEIELSKVLKPGDMKVNNDVEIGHGTTKMETSKVSN
ncbi:peptidylprolyl isomerase [Halarcobacter ebronensis]|uniref:Peptidyl-prolyl cis-trans isomerase n=1 Tax=Halarcobacter ebronensis TaxID=1462615 RepID=A0A4Q0YEY8_9BACT|nr:FKBP-type peptidyl-prolyl cis-trans isomerase [Halarcobacter ebronensis]RXJ69126.1 peptidylprolyl isomerase [Halarcobacter ebronensis]